MSLRVFWSVYVSLFFVCVFVFFSACVCFCVHSCVSGCVILCVLVFSVRVCVLCVVRLFVSSVRVSVLFVFWCVFVSLCICVIVFGVCLVCVISPKSIVEVVFDFDNISCKLRTIKVRLL
jgi:hypothetical protein